MKNKKMRVVLIKPEIHDQLKARKKEIGINVNRLVEFAIMRYLKQERKNGNI